MLFKELEKKVAAIESYDNREGWQAFVDELSRRKIAGLDHLSPLPNDRESIEVVRWAQLAIGAGWYTRLVKPLPVIISILKEILKSSDSPAYHRCALAGALVYLVREDDLIRDASKGGYGYVDDSLVAHYTFYKYLKEVEVKVEDAPQALSNYYKEVETLIRSGLNICPSGILDQLRKSFTEIAMGFYHLREVPTYVLDSLTEQIIRNPFQSSIQKTLSRLAYHLDVHIQSYDYCLHNDPVLSFLDSMVADRRSSPGDLSIDPDYSEASFHFF